MAAPRQYHLPSVRAEDPECYRPGRLHPIHLGDVLKDGQYTVIYKLGYGSWSTAWLCKDSRHGRYVNVKVEDASQFSNTKELEILRLLSDTQTDHPGKLFVAQLLDDFVIAGPNGSHRCYVTEAGCRSMSIDDGPLNASLAWRLTIAKQATQALHFMHSLGLCHGDIFPPNFILKMSDLRRWSEYEVREYLDAPITEKVKPLNGSVLEPGMPQYVVARPNAQKLENQFALDQIMLIDFGQSYHATRPPSRLITPRSHGPPENLLGAPISPASEVWSLACTIFEICAGYTLLTVLFNPQQDALKDMISMLGKPNESLWQLWTERSRYFHSDGTALQRDERSLSVESRTLHERVGTILTYGAIDLDQEDQRVNGGTTNGNSLPVSQRLSLFEELLAQMLRFDPNERCSLEHVLEHPIFVNQ